MVLVSGDVPQPTGPAAQLLIAAAWPGMSESALADLAGEQQALANAANAYGDQVMRDLTQQRELLKGAAGDAHQALMGKLRDHAYAAADHFDTKAAAAQSYKAVVYGLKMRLSQIADAAEHDWNNNPPAARPLVIAAYAPEVASAVADALGDFHTTPAPSPTPPSPITGTPTAPGNETPKNDPTIQAVDNKTQGGKYTENTATSDTTTTTTDESQSGKYTENTATSDTTTTTTDESQSGKYTGNTATPATSPSALAGVSQMPVTSMPSSPSMPSSSSVPSMPSSPLSSAGGLAKAGNPLSGGSVAGSPVSGGPSMPSAPSATTSAQGMGGGSPLVNATQSFQSGLASGLGSPGAVPPPGSGRAVEPVMGQPVAAQPAGAQAGVPQPASAPSVASPGPAAAAAYPGGGAGHAGAGMGSGGALAPFVPPGGAQPAPPPAATAAAAASPAVAASSSSAQPGGQQPAPGGAPMVAATSGATTAGMLPERDPNPDLAVARRVLTGLILGAAAAPDPVVVDWAVSVLNTSMGKQVVIASSMGGGGYVPATVALPADARLAVVDRALPMGWAAVFCGWPSPVDILVAHSEKVAERLAGVSISAIAATNSGQASAYRPPGVADYLTVSLADVLKAGGVAPVFGGGYRHRMTGVDPDLAQRVAMVDRGGDATIQLASQMTAAVVRAAQEESLHTGTALVAADDIDLLSALGGGAAIDWAEHYHQVSQRENNAMFYPAIKAAPRDLDESQTSINSRAVYQHYYRMGRLVELVRCWQHTPPSVLDIAYCGTAAGFGASVAAVTAAWEQHLNRPIAVR
ncbi:MAG: hypothetical protein QG655_3495 [Actinomycetota bacterium]|nr:hypothetical protein [Actinomycetota bacterium]